MIKHHFTKNENGRDFVIGDIHGMYSLLLSALENVNFDRSTDRLFSVGDVIDRGVESGICLDLFYEPWFHAVMGNHEEMMFDAVVGNQNASDWVIYNGGHWVIDYDQDVLEGVCQDLSKRLPYIITVDTDEGITGIVHAEVPNNGINSINDPLSHGDMMYLTWARSKLKSGDTSPVKDVDTLYVGHSYVPIEGTKLGNVVYTDHGSVFNDNPFKLYRIN